MDELKDKKWYEDVPYEECKKFISARLRTMTRDFIVVGYYLKYIRDNELYKEDGYTSIWEFAEDNYGIKTSTASRWMAMNDKFSQDGNTPLLDKQYQDFGKSQLQEMLYLTDEQLAQAKPDMPAKEIRAIRKPEKKSYEESENEPCSKCKLNGNEDAGILECHPEEGEHKCVIDYAEPSSQEKSWREACEEGECPPISTCIRQEWGTNEQEQIVGHKECVKCWEKWVKEQKFLGTAASESVAPAQEHPTEEKSEVLHFTADDRSIDNAYGAMIAELVHNYLDNGYKSPDKECEAYVFGQTYKVLKRPEVTVFYTGDGQTFFDVENARLEREYQYWQRNKTMQEQTDDIINEPEGFEVEEESEECSSAPEVVITPQDVLHEAQKQLNDWIEAFKDDAEPDFIGKQKIIVAALASMVCDLDNTPPEPEPQPELPPLKNNEQRKEWLNDYKSWGLWYSDDHIGARYYRYQFEGGAVLIVEEYTVPATEYFEEHDQRYFHLVGGPEPPKGKHGYGKWQRHECYRRDVSSETELVEFLKEIQKR